MVDLKNKIGLGLKNDYKIFQYNTHKLTARRSVTPTVTGNLPNTSTSSGGTLRIGRRSRSKSPFRSFRWKRSSAKLSDDSDGEERSGIPSEDVEGYLTRKHEWESTTKKASNRSWDKIYIISRGGRMTFFKDQKTAKQVPEITFRGEPPLELHGAVTEVASDYTKKKHVFRIKLSNGGEYLLQAHDDSEMNQWVNALKAQCESHTAGEGRSQTLPASSQKDEPKKRSFFTLKKK